MTDRKKNIRIYLPIVLALVLISGIILGFLLQNNLSQKSGIPFVTGENRAYNKVDEIIQFVENNYVDSVNREHLETDAIKGMLNDLDPHSQYITAAEFNEINDPLLGSFEGIGISFRIEKDTIMVVNPIPGGPSEKAGLMAGDRIVKVNDTLVAGVHITNNEAMHKLKGKKGTKVRVTIYRRGVPKLLHFTITRGIIPMYSLDIAYMINKTLGYIKLNKFSATTYEEFDQAVRKLKKEGMKKLILDLRGNPGGYLNAAIRVADEFLPAGKLIVYTKGLHRPKTVAYSTAKGELKQTDVAVLIDEGTASAAEIVTGALQDNDIGVVIGRRSFGKGLVQEQIRLPDGSALRLTVARYYTPTGRCIQKPYKKDDFKDYYAEAYRRYLDGEMQHPDSIKFNDSLKFVTPKGKVVYGGGGIMPDIYVPLVTDTLHSFYNILANKGLIYQFAFDYTDAHRPQLRKYKDFDSFNQGFHMTEKEYRDLVAFAKSKGITESPRKVKLSENRIKILFKAYVGRNILDEKGFYPIYHEIDPVFKKAVQVMEHRHVND
jgi:carboxyl-terminal processing protease